MTSPIPGGIFTESRIGIVTVATVNSMFVDVGGTVLEVAFIIPFTNAAVAAPAPGTIVQLIRQDASWVALGKIVGAGSNSVLNPSFEDSPAGIQPVNWNSYDVSGTSTALTEDIEGAPGGDFAVRVFSAQTSVHYLYSNPIAVTAGQIWSLSAFVGGDYEGGVAATADAALVGLWFANDTNLYPTTSSADIVVATSTDVPQYPPFVAISGNVTAPVTGFMRVALRSTLSNQALVWDTVVARLV